MIYKGTSKRLNANLAPAYKAKQAKVITKVIFYPEIKGE